MARLAVGELRLCPTSLCPARSGGFSRTCAGDRCSRGLSLRIFLHAHASGRNVPSGSTFSTFGNASRLLNSISVLASMPAAGVGRPPLDCMLGSRWSVGLLRRPGFQASRNGASGELHRQAGHQGDGPGGHAGGKPPRGVVEGDARQIHELPTLGWARWAASSRRRDPRDNKRSNCRDDDVKNQRTEPNVERITDATKVDTCERLQPIAPRGPRSPDNSSGPTQQ